jgi:phosphoadenosine phosphosulfate reductase
LIERQPSLSTNDALKTKSRAEELTRRYENQSAHDIVRDSCAELFPNRVAAVSSFGAEAAILLHMISEVAPATPIIFLDTDKHFSETSSYVTRLTRELGLGVLVSAYPGKAEVEAEDPAGTLCSRDVDRCCHIRKTLPMMRALRPYQAYFTGRKQFQTQDRQSMASFEVYGRWLRINPLWNWGAEQVQDYFSTHNLPTHPLVSEGYRSIGCQPCTRAVKEDEDPRAGRWADSEKTECGIHITPDGKVIRTTNGSS